MDLERSFGHAWPSIYNYFKKTWPREANILDEVHGFGWPFKDEENSFDNEENHCFSHVCVGWVVICPVTLPLTVLAIK